MAVFKSVAGTAAYALNEQLKHLKHYLQCFHSSRCQDVRIDGSALAKMTCMLGVMEGNCVAPTTTHDNCTLPISNCHDPCLLMLAGKGLTYAAFKPMLSMTFSMQAL